jgi:para-nitrobenzyl esterase
LSSQMMDALIAMADTGSPSTKAMPWAAWTSRAETRLVFGDAVNPVKLNPKNLDWFAAHPVAALPAAPRSNRPRD